MWSDPIADMLTRIRNAAQAHMQTVMIPNSKVKTGIARVLKEEGYIEDYDLIEDNRQGLLRVALKYGPMGERVIQSLGRVSRGGRRVYRGYEDLPRVLDGLGVAVVSTSRGILSDRECREQKVGGEVLCTVY
ncbi:MAG: 30S ribosomal protein S8 [Phycisphaerales bacterium]|nr:MAG: 30S ribosomal protein S8 [Phycisphaerales bacterium]